MIRKLLKPPAINSRWHKWKWGVVVLLAALACVAFWPWASPKSAVRVTFQHATNDPENGRVGVIELVNTRNATVDIMGAWYVPAVRKDMGVSKDTPIAEIYGGMPRLGAQSTNLVQVSLPTNGGPYRLVLQCVPDRTSPWRTEGTLRYRSVWLVAPLLHPSQQALVRWFGGCFAASDAIDVPH